MQVFADAQIFRLSPNDNGCPAVSRSQTSTALAARILRLLHQDAVEPGHRIPIPALCYILEASPHQVKSALKMLDRQGAICWRNAREFILDAAPEDAIRPLRAFSATYAPKVTGNSALLESRDFRLVIEPMSLTSLSGRAALALQPIWMRHRDLLAQGCTDVAILSDLDMEFHDFLVRLSGNRFFIEFVREPLALMRRSDSRDAMELQRDLADHLEILAALEQGKVAAAAELLARHLGDAFKLQRDAASHAALEKSYRGRESQ